MECNTCKHEFVCKYKDEYIRVKRKSENEFKGIFYISCNEYIDNKNERNAGRKPKFKNSTHEEIRELYECGNTMRDLARSYKCSVGHIHKILTTGRD